MAGSFEKDIVLRITANAELTAITNAIAKLQELQKASQGIFSQAGGAAPLAAANQQASGLTANITAAVNAQAEFNKRAAEAAKILETQGRVTKQTLFENTKGEFSTTTQKEAPGGLKLVSSTTGTNRLTFDQNKADQESLAALKAANSQTQREIDAISASFSEKRKARTEQEKLGARQAADTEREQIQRLQSDIDRIATATTERQRARRQQEILGQNQANDAERQNVQRLQSDINQIARESSEKKKAALKSEADETKKLQRDINTDLKIAADQKKAQQNRDVENFKAAAAAEQAQRGRATFGQLAAATPGSTVQTVKGFDQVTQQLTTQKVLFDANSNAIARLNDNTGKLSVSNAALTGEINKSSDSLQNAAGKVLLWTVATGAVFGSIRAAKAVVENFKDVELATTALSVVARGFGSSQDAIAQGSKNVSAEILKLKVAFGSTGGEALSAAQTFARLGLNQRDTIEATKTALLASNVAFISASDAANLLASAYQQFGLSARDIPGILDNLNTLSNTNKISTNDLLQSISRSGAVFREAGGTLQELGAITATVAEVTSRSGAEIGNALKTIASRLGDAKVQADIFATSGIVIANVAGELKPINQIFQEMALFIQGATDAERANLTITAAGVRQRNQLVAALDNVLRSQVNVINQLTDTTSAAAENEKIMGTLAKKIEQLQAAFERLSVALGEAGVGKAVKAAVGAFASIVDAIASIPGIAITVVGILALYGAAIIAAAIGSAPFIKSLINLKDGFLLVNKLILQSATDLTISRNKTLSAAEANNILAQSLRNVANAKSSERSNAGATSANALAFAAAAKNAPVEVLPVTGFAEKAGTAFRIAGAIVGKIFIVAAVAEIGISIFEATKSAITSARLDLLDLGPAPKFKKEQEGAQQRTALAEKDLAATQQTITLFDLAIARLEALNIKKESGVGLTEKENGSRLQLEQQLLSLSSLDGDLRRKVIEDQITINDLLEERNKLAGGVADKTNNELTGLEQELAIIKRQIAEREKQLSTGKKTGIRPVGFFEDTFDATIALLKAGFGQKVQKAPLTIPFAIEINDAEKTQILDEVKDLKSQLAPVENKILKIGIEKAAFDNTREDLTKLKDDLDEISFQRKLKLDFDVGVASTELEKTRLKLVAIKLEELDIAKLRQSLTQLNRELSVGEQKLIDDDLKKLRREKLAAIQNEEQTRILNDRKISQIRTQGREQFREKAAGFVAAGQSPELLADLNRERAVLDEKQRNELKLKEFKERLETELTTKPSPTRRKEIEEELQQVNEELFKLGTAKEEQRVRVALQGLDTQKKISDEYKKQTEELTKQTAGLSDFDLAKVRIAEKQIKEGTFKPFTQEQFKNLGGEQRKFFGETLQSRVPGFQVVQPDTSLSANIRLKGLAASTQDVSFFQKALEQNPILLPSELKGQINTGTFTIGNAIFGSLVPSFKKPTGENPDVILAKSAQGLAFGARTRALPQDIAESQIKNFNSPDIQDFFRKEGDLSAAQRDLITKLFDVASKTPLGNRTFGEVGGSERQLIQNLSDAVIKLSSIPNVPSITGQEFASGAAQSVNINFSGLSTPLEKWKDGITIVATNIVEDALDGAADKFIDTARTRSKNLKVPRSRNR